MTIGPCMAFRSQTEIDAIELTELAGFGQNPHHRAAQPLKVLLVVDRMWTVGVAIAVVDEYQIDIAGVIQFQATQFPHADHDEFRISGRGPAVALVQLLLCQLPRGLARGVGQIGQLTSDGLQGLSANQIAKGNTSRLSVPECI